jgi:hypothetical protein
MRTSPLVTDPTLTSVRPRKGRIPIDREGSIFDRGNAASDYCMVNPPSTAYTCPVMYLASLEARKTANPVRSSGESSRPRGT